MVPCEFKLKIDGEALEDFGAKAIHSELSIIMLLFSIQRTTVVDDHLSLNSAARRRKVLKLGVLFVISSGRQKVSDTRVYL